MNTPTLEIPDGRAVPDDPDTLRRRLFIQNETLLAAARDLARAVAALPADKRFADTVPRARLVGGFVRDAVLGLRPKDLDIEIGGVAPEVLEPLLDRLFHGLVHAVGRSFGVYRVALGDGYILDVSIPRRESKHGRGHTGFMVAGDPAMTPTEAARRRDFTMNALSADPLTGAFFDPFGGLADLRRGRLRVIDETRFANDPLRVYRAVGFAARFELEPDPACFSLLSRMVERGDLDELSRERIAEEWKKLLLRARRPSRGLRLLRSLGIITRDYPELQALIGVRQEHEWHPEGDVWEHTLMVVDAAASLIRQPERGLSPDGRLAVMLGALCHDLGKPATTSFIDGRIRSRGHEAAGVEPARAFLRRWRFSSFIQRSVAATIETHLKPGMLNRGREDGHLDEDAYRNAVRRLLNRIDPVPWRVLLAVAEADHRGRGLPGAETGPYPAGERFAAAVASGGLDTAGRAPLISGRDLLALGVPAGRRVGELIRAVENLRDRGKIKTKEQAFAAIIDILRARYTP